MTKKEPAADIRQAADIARQMYQALIDEEFTEEQALKIVAQMFVHRNED